MKLQHLAVIFVIIILPISLLVGEYIHNQINTINLQTAYNNKLQTATYDAVQAFVLNTVNNEFSTISDSKLRDINASINSFYNSLGQEMKLSTYSREDLSQFTPALLYTMYDGYYIYSKFLNEESNEYEYGIKPYIYYTCRYKNTLKGIDIIVNYTLDNYITIYGRVNGEYITKSGYLINPNWVTAKQYDTSGNIKQLKYNGIIINKEVLKENIIYLDGATAYRESDVNYIMFDNNKVYLNKNASNNSEKYFLINSQNKKQYIKDNNIIQKLNSKLGSDGYLYSDSALKYYEEAQSFSNWVKTNLGYIKQTDAFDAQGNNITDFYVKTTDSVFDCSKFGKFPETEITGSSFDLNRMDVIIRSIKSNLQSAIANYNHYENTSYDFVLPVLSEEDWYSVANNISMVSFMQGIPIGYKYYNNYCIVLNNKNKEVVNLNSLYIIANGEVHLLECKDIIDNNLTIDKVYKNIDFERKTVTINENNKVYNYQHFEPRCYDCLINTNALYKIDFLNGKIQYYNSEKEKYEDKTLDTTEKRNKFKALRTEVLTALAREKYDLYKANNYSN